MNYKSITKYEALAVVNTACYGRFSELGGGYVARVEDHPLVSLADWTELTSEPLVSWLRDKIRFLIKKTPAVKAARYGPALEALESYEGFQRERYAAAIVFGEVINKYLIETLR